MSITEPPVLAFITEADRLAVGPGSLPGDPPTMDAAVQQLLDLRAANAKVEPDKADTDKADTDKTHAEKADTDKPGTDKADADKADADKPGTDKAEADKADVEKVDRDKEEADKLHVKEGVGKEALVEKEPLSDKSDLDGDDDDDDDDDDPEARWFSGSLGGRAPVVM
jgi:hypothetical protein